MWNFEFAEAAWADKKFGFAADGEVNEGMLVLKSRFVTMFDESGHGPNSSFSTSFRSIFW